MTADAGNLPGNAPVPVPVGGGPGAAGGGPVPVGRGSAPGPDGGALAPVREALLAAARAEADAVLARAEAEANRALDAARREADRIRAEAREHGRAQAERVLAADRARARREARAVVLAARREAYEAVRAAVREALAAGYDTSRREALVRAARAVLGPDVRIVDAPGGGILGEVPGRRVDLSLAGFADRAVTRDPGRFDTLSEVESAEIHPSSGGSRG